MYRFITRLTHVITSAAAAVALAVGCSEDAQAQTQESSASAVLRLKFLDSETGVGIVPDAVIIDGAFYSPGGRGSREEMVVPLEEGDHIVTVKAQGYKDLTSRQTALPEDEAPLNAISLDPAEPPFGLREDILRKHLPPGGSVIAGYVVDDTTGEPIKDAVVAMAGITTRTNELGYFVLPASLSDAQRLPEDDGSGTMFARRGFSVYKPGYGPVERRNVLLLVGIPKTFRLRLVPGNTPDIADEEESRGNLPASTFGFPTDSHVFHLNPSGHEGHNHAPGEPCELETTGTR